MRVMQIKDVNEEIVNNFECRKWHAVFRLMPPRSALIFFIIHQHRKNVHDHFFWSWAAMITLWSRKSIIRAHEPIMDAVIIILTHIEATKIMAHSRLHDLCVKLMIMYDRHDNHISMIEAHLCSWSLTRSSHREGLLVITMSRRPKLASEKTSTAENANFRFWSRCWC